MQVYRALDIGTAKPACNELQQIKHHLLSIADISEDYNLNKYLVAAEACFNEIKNKGKLAILVGGSGLYARALIYEMELLPANKKLAKEINQLSLRPDGEEIIIAKIKEKLSNKDSEIPEVTLQNPRRLMRALEVIELTGKAPWEYKQELQKARNGFLQFCLLPDLSLLKKRIARRAEIMLEQGWIDEALNAEKAGLLNSPTAKQALGYRDIINFVRVGSPGGIKAIAELLTKKTIQYARRQMTWFRNQHPGAIAIKIEQEENAVSYILDIIKKELECRK